VDHRRRALTRELGLLVGLVLLVDGIFIGLHYALRIAAAPPAVRLGYTILWTALTLLIVLRALARIRRIRTPGGVRQ
jgi:hypothetical protein